MNITKMLEEKKRFIPDEGFNVVAVDEFEPPGEALYLVEHYADEGEANTKAKQHEKGQGDRTFVYDKNTK